MRQQTPHQKATTLQATKELPDPCLDCENKRKCADELMACRLFAYIASNKPEHGKKRKGKAHNPIEYMATLDKEPSRAIYKKLYPGNTQSRDNPRKHSKSETIINSSLIGYGMTLVMP